MADLDFTKYQKLVTEALRAFKTDSSYAEDMARQANILRSRQAARRDRELELERA